MEVMLKSNDRSDKKGINGNENLVQRYRVDEHDYKISTTYKIRSSNTKLKFQNNSYSSHKPLGWGKLDTF